MIDLAQAQARRAEAAHDAVIRVYDEAGNVAETHESPTGLLQNFLCHVRKCRMNVISGPKGNMQNI